MGNIFFSFLFFLFGMIGDTCLAKFFSTKLVSNIFIATLFQITDTFPLLNSLAIVLLNSLVIH